MLISNHLVCTFISYLTQASFSVRGLKILTALSFFYFAIVEGMQNILIERCLPFCFSLTCLRHGTLLFEKLMVTHLVKKSSLLRKPGSSLPC